MERVIFYYGIVMRVYRGINFLHLPLKVVSFKKVEGAEKRLPPSLESEAAPQGLAEFHVQGYNF